MLTSPRSPTLSCLFSCSPYILHHVLTSYSPHSKDSFQESSAIAFDRVLYCLHYLVAANSTEAPLVWFSLACGNVSKTAVSFGNSFIHLPSLPSFLPPSLFYLPPSTSPSPISLIEDQLTRTKRLQTWVGAGDNMKNIAYHEKLILKAPRGLIVRPTINQTNTPCSPPASSCSSHAPDSLLFQASLGRRTQRWFVRYFTSFFFYYHFAFF